MKTNQKILIIENDVKIANWLRRALEHPLGGGHHVEVMLTSQTVESKLQHAQFDLIIISLEPAADTEHPADAKHPADIIKKTQALVPTTPILCIMDHDTAEHLVFGDGSSDVRYLNKPFEIQTFVSLVQETLGT
jgi:DNA-binding response OmpR family regulator